MRLRQPRLPGDPRRARCAAARRRDGARGAGRWLGVGVASAANLVNPGGVVVGGYFATLAPWLMPGLRAELDDRVLAAEWDAPRIVTSALGAAAAVRGASAQALRRVFADPSLVAFLVRS